jgi:hypothetical protein
MASEIIKIRSRKLQGMTLVFATWLNPTIMRHKILPFCTQIESKCKVQLLGSITITFRNRVSHFLIVVQQGCNKDWFLPHRPQLRLLIKYLHSMLITIISLTLSPQHLEETLWILTQECPHSRINNHFFRERLVIPSLWKAQSRLFKVRQSIIMYIKLLSCIKLWTTGSSVFLLKCFKEIST